MTKIPACFDSVFPYRHFERSREISIELRSSAEVRQRNPMFCCSVFPLFRSRRLSFCCRDLSTSLEMTIWEYP